MYRLIYDRGIISSTQSIVVGLGMQGSTLLKLNSVFN